MLAHAQKQAVFALLTPANLASVELYLANQDSIPSDLAAILCEAVAYSKATNPTGRDTQTRLSRQLAKALGVVPSSEKLSEQAQAKSLDGLRRIRQKPKSERERLQHEIGESERLAAIHKERCRAQKLRSKKAQKKLKELQMSDNNVIDPLTPEQRAEEDAQRADLRQGLKRVGPVDPALAPPSERLMAGGLATHHEQDVCCHVERDELKKSDVIVQTFEVERKRIDFTLTLTVLNVKVEKAAVRRGAEITMVTGDMQQFGPPKFKVTWQFLANMALLIADYAMPMHRFARMVTTQVNKLTSTHISRYFAYVAQFFVPIYVHLGRSLANAPVLCGDDTPSLVLQVAKSLILQDAAADAPVKMPWDDYATADIAKTTIAQKEQGADINTVIAAQFGFASQRKDKKGAKRSFNTSVLSGRTDANDPTSTVVFYRSHLGSVGNLLDAILPERKAELKKLVIQTDLSTTNLISDKAWAARFDIHLAGCASHARRPFAMYRKLDPEICDGILSGFWLVAHNEKMLNLHGRNQKNVLYVRDIHSRDRWDFIHEQCELVLMKWPKNSPLGEGANYIRKNLDKLTYYLTDASVSPDANFSERMLRQEKLIENNAMFRQSLAGRCALDVVRTIIQTAQAANVSPEEYLQWVMKMPPEAVAEDPNGFTPHCFAAWKIEQGRATANEDLPLEPEG